MLIYEFDEKKAAEQYQTPNAPAKRYPIVSRHWNLAGLVHANPEAYADQERRYDDDRKRQP